MNPYRDASSFVDVLRFRARHTPDRVAFRYLPDGETESAVLTYAQLDTAARTVAAALQSMSAPAGQALLLYPPGLDFVAAFWGCLYAGVAAVPVYPPRPNQSLARLQAIVVDSQATVALTTAAQLPALERRAGDAQLGALRWLATDDLPVTAADAWVGPGVTREDLAFLQYTSGSTGSPKGVLVSHANLLHNSEFLRQCFELTADSVSVTWLPSFHDMGLIDGILQPTYSGFLAVVMPPVAFLQTPVRWLQALTKYRATHCGGPNFCYDLCARKVTPDQLATLDLSSWITAYNGAEPVHKATLDLFAQRFEPCGFRARYFYPCYGMAESTLIISGGRVSSEPVYFAADADALEEHRVVDATPDTARTKHLVGNGRAWLDTQIVIADPDTLQRCPSDRVGEIWTAGASVTTGYWNRPDLANETFARLADTGEGPYLRTGDLGFVRGDELFVTGRIKDVIIIRGQNHYPQDIETTVQECSASLRPACGAAFTIEANGDQRLVVVSEVERTHLRQLDAPALVKKIREAVANEHGLQVSHVVLIKPASIPKTSSGKIQRRACRQRFLDGTLEVVSPREGV